MTSANKRDTTANAEDMQYEVQTTNFGKAIVVQALEIRACRCVFCCVHRYPILYSAVLYTLPALSSGNYHHRHRNYHYHYHIGRKSNRLLDQMGIPGPYVKISELRGLNSSDKWACECQHGELQFNVSHIDCKSCIDCGGSR